MPSLPPGTRVAVVVSTYHAELTGTMGASAARTLRAAGVAAEDLLEFPAPGAFELPLLAQRLAARRDVNAVLCFGLVLKGETEHDRYIAGAVADGLMRIALDHEKPVLFGVLTCATLEQAWERAHTREEGGFDKGHEVAAAAIGALHSLHRASQPGPAPEETP